MNWKKTNKRFVAYFDIMGFKNLVQTNDHNSVLDLMEKISTLVKSIDSVKFESIKSDTTLKTVIFSDSILIISTNSSIASAANLMFHSSYLVSKATELGIPIKGAIAYGKFTADFEKSLFFGQPLIDAYLLEEELYLYSVVLHHSFETFLYGKTYQAKFPDNVRWIKHQTPFKTGKSYHYHLNWIFYALYDKPENYDLYKKYIYNFYKNVSGRTRAYVDNTLAIFEEMHKYTLE